jgi:hypothetical protein
MSDHDPRPVLTVYRRERCEMCDEVRELLQGALEERATRGELVPAVREVDVATHPELESRYGGLVPVLALGDREQSLVLSGRQVRAFLDRTLARLA